MLHKPWLAIECPHCNAREGADCSAVGSNQPLIYSAAHPSRMEKVGLAHDRTAVERARE